MTQRRGTVYLVGAGPGDPGLMTLRGLKLLRRADVVLYDRLVSRDLLSLARPDAELIDVGKRPGDQRSPQEDINRRLVEFAGRCRRVVRLKGGDPYVFGRGSEEVDACKAAGIRCIVVPGVSSALAAPASVGISLTYRGLSNSFAVITGTEAGNTLSGQKVPDHDYAALARLDTLVLLMARHALRGIIEQLLTNGMNRNMPAACIASATTPRQRHVIAPLGELCDRVEEAGLENPCVIVIGNVVSKARKPASGSAVAPSARKPLRGRRIVITRTRSGNDELTRLLRHAGAELLHVPLIRIEYPAIEEPFPLTAADLARFNWLAFTSGHGVDGLWRRLRSWGRDARACGHLRLAAIGPATSEALRRRGLEPDIVPSVYNGAALAEAMLGAADAPSMRVLHPRGNLARTELESILREDGVEVESVEVYRTLPTIPPKWAYDELARGVDAVLFGSPSAVRQFRLAGLDAGDAVMGCLGPTTAQALRAAGLRADVVPVQSDARSLVEALIRRFQLKEART